MIADLINRECQLTHRSESDQTDDFGNEIPNETTVTTVCEFQSQRDRGETEISDQNELAESRWDVFFRAGEQVAAGDALVVDGVKYEIEGEPWPARHPQTGEYTHIEASAKRVSGSEDTE